MGNDARVKKTKQKLHDALLGLLDKKSISAVTVSELCAAAQVRRSTFYTHYSIPSDVLDELCREHEEAALKAISLSDSHGDYKKMLTAICGIMLDNSRFFSYLCKSSAGLEYLRGIADLSNKFFLDGFFKNTSAPRDDVRFVNRFATGGTLILLNDWCIGGMKEPVPQLVEKLDSITTLLLKQAASGALP